MKTVRMFFAALCCLTVFATFSQASDMRFSKTLSPADRSEVGVDRLNADQIAILDALIRRDATMSRMKSRPQSDRFSERLLDDERRNAGLDLLNGRELERLDDLVQFHRSLSINPPPMLGSRVSSDARLRPEVVTREKGEVHGTYSLWYSMGSGGYSQRGASMTATYVDPSRRVSVTVGYATARTNGPAIYRDDRGYDNRMLQPSDPRGD